MIRVFRWKVNPAFVFDPFVVENVIVVENVVVVENVGVVVNVDVNGQKAGSAAGEGKNISPQNVFLKRK